MKFKITISYIKSEDKEKEVFITPIPEQLIGSVVRIASEEELDEGLSKVMTYINLDKILRIESEITEYTREDRKKRNEFRKSREDRNKCGGMPFPIPLQFHEGGCKGENESDNDYHI